ncbi:MAG: glycosyltransferase family 2 protein [Beijerinckiaceae bacterium]|nr:glycosyltransferase family 2 protein [Beijerinckiaceae bacterium]
MSLAITIVIPTKNEERNLARCLAPLSEFAEIVIIDSGSTDATREIAAANCVRVVDFSWNGAFPKKRNWMLRNYAFSTPWVLFLDADEVIGPAFIEELRTMIPTTAHVGFWLNYSNFFMGEKLKHGVPQRKLALFRVGSGEYERIEEDRWSALDMEVHEHPVLAGSVGEIACPIEHNDFKSLHHFIDRHNQYSSWEARRTFALNRKGAEGLTRRQAIKYRFVTQAWFAFAYFGLQYFIKLGILDGRAGLLYAFYKFSYFLDVRQKYLEHMRQRPGAS